jgi:hypothetical protein
MAELWVPATEWVNREGVCLISDYMGPLSQGTVIMGSLSAQGIGVALDLAFGLKVCMGTPMPAAIDVALVG